MLGTHPSTLLLYPEWIIWLVIGFLGANLVFAAASLALLADLRRRDAADLSLAREELACLRAAHRDLEIRHGARRDRLSELAAEHEALRRRYDALWREHQEFADELGPLLPDDPHDAPEILVSPRP
jgi:hypothetical protein